MQGEHNCKTIFRKHNSFDWPIGMMQLLIVDSMILACIDDKLLPECHLLLFQPHIMNKLIGPKQNYKHLNYNQNNMSFHSLIVQSQDHIVDMSTIHSLQNMNQLNTTDIVIDLQMNLLNLLNMAGILIDHLHSDKLLEHMDNTLVTLLRYWMFPVHMIDS